MKKRLQERIQDIE